ncbi:MAG TPA: SDR family NAD(P)-dependent oxidoreductase [Kofleriaceae bacterium]|jgi:NAD(P)-dependent dehydrogenase (short-subunit alcohol dehydrogenase family)|nr:SDR family NAD(P)-dependent oxidoreductase [Kofleriaceae bacterium]
MADLTNVVVTGGTGALGAGVVELFLARGATVHLPMMEPALPAHVPWRDHARVKATPGVSLDDEKQVEQFYASLPSLWASVHLVGGFAMAKLADTSLADFEKQWRMNTVTCFLACREAVKAMRRSGNGGRIVNVAARPAISPAPGMISYVTSKAGVAALTQSLAPELLAEGILINAVLPSTIDTPANRKSMPNADHTKWPKPAEIAETIGFLASEQNSLTTGTLVPVYGQA